MTLGVPSISRSQVLSRTKEGHHPRWRVARVRASSGRSTARLHKQGGEINNSWPWVHS